MLYTVYCILCNLYYMIFTIPCIVYHAYYTFRYYIGRRLCKYFEYYKIFCYWCKHCNINYIEKMFLFVKFCWVLDPPKVHHWGGRDGGRRHGGDRLSWHLFHDVHSSYIVAAAIGASAGGCTLGAATYNTACIIRCIIHMLYKCIIQCRAYDARLSVLYKIFRVQSCIIQLCSAALQYV